MKIVRYAAFAALLIPALTYAEDNASVQTPFGVVSITPGPDGTSVDSYLTFRGKAVTPSVKANSSLSLEKTFRLSNDKIAILVIGYGGTGCPAEDYRWLLVGKGGYRLSTPFGTCSDLYKAEIKDNKLIVTMPGFMGPFEPVTAQRKAAKTRHAYSYDGQHITESTYAAKGFWQQ